MPPDAAAQVRLLAARHGGPSDIIPSLYLHLAYWPRLLDVLPRWLAALYAPGVLEQVCDATRGLAEAEAALLSPVSTQLPAGTEAAIGAALRHFTNTSSLHFCRCALPSTKRVRQSRPVPVIRQPTR